MRKVLITYAGGRGSIGICRALKAGPEPPHIIGVDSDKYAVHRVVGEEHFIVPRGNDPLFVPVIKHLVERTGADFVWPVHETDIAAIVNHADQVPARTFLPDAQTIARGQDKFVSAELFKAAGLAVPETRRVGNESELRAAFADLGPDIWVRKTRGAGGKGSLPVSDYDRAMHWIGLHGGFEDFVAAKRIEGRRFKSESIWHRGKLIAMQSSESLALEFSSLTMSGITGIGRSERFATHPAIDDASQRAVYALTSSPHGIFATDMLVTEDNTPYVTEVNVGRFASGSFSHTITKNMNAPYLAYRLAHDEMPEFEPPLINPFPRNVVTIKGWLHEPSQVPASQIDREVAEYEALLAELGGRESQSGPLRRPPLG